MRDTRTAHTDRRAFLGLLAAAGLIAPALSACGTDGPAGQGGQDEAVGSVSYIASSKTRTTGSAKDESTAAAAVSAFTADLYARVAATEHANVVCSPYSVAFALAMTATGARGGTATQIDHVLHAGPGYVAGLARLDDQVRSRAHGKKVALQTASSLWGQRGVTWRAPFLDALAADLGAGMHVVDFEHSTEPARVAINDWTADHTADRIQDLLAPGVLDASTRLVLVDAIHLKAGWAEPFEKALTRHREFTRRDSSVVRVPMMSATLEGTGFATGAGWRAARLPYDGDELAMAVVVPDDARAIDDVERSIAGDGLAALLAGFEPTPVDVLLPRWRTRTSVSLKDPLKAVGMSLAFSDGADFSGMTADERLRIDAVEHQAWIAVDEDGTEAAAATAAVVGAMSARAPRESRPVHADRPFLHVVYDQPTGTPLFVGRVDDPSAPSA